MAQGKASPVPFVRGAQPILDGGDAAYSRRELDAIKVSLDSTQAFAVYAITKAPDPPLDGMRRLSRWPWWPVSGQAADAWVYYDAVGKVWRYDATAPTSSH
jgi:hypothetical protein